MRTAIGVVEEGRVRLPEDMWLPEGQRVLVQWDEESTPRGPYLEREPLTLEEIGPDIEWASGARFPSTTDP